LRTITSPLPAQNNARNMGMLGDCVAQQRFTATAGHRQIANENINVRGCVKPSASLFRIEGKHGFPFEASATQVSTDA
jgi:hypothetical protein